MRVDPAGRQISELLDDFDDDEEEEEGGASGLLIPKYEFMYKQAVSTADAFLGMSHNKVRGKGRGRLGAHLFFCPHTKGCHFRPRALLESTVYITSTLSVRAWCILCEGYTTCTR